MKKQPVVIVKFYRKQPVVFPCLLVPKMAADLLTANIKARGLDPAKLSIYVACDDPILKKKYEEAFAAKGFNILKDDPRPKPEAKPAPERPRP